MSSSKAVAEKVHFLRQDHRGHRFRNLAQQLCFRAIEYRPNLNDAEKDRIIRAINCYPEDAHRFCKYAPSINGPSI